MTAEHTQFVETQLRYTLAFLHVVSIDDTTSIYLLESSVPVKILTFWGLGTLF